MGGGGRFAAAAVLAAGLFGCDSTQPLQVGEQQFAVQFRAGGASVPVYNVYDMIEDTPRCAGDPSVRCDGDAICGAAAPCEPSDNQADDADGDGVPDTFLWCRRAQTTDTSGTHDASTVASSVPHGFTLEVTILPANTVFPEPVTSPDALFEAANRANYDTTVPRANTPPTLAPIVETRFSPPRTYRFSNARQRSAADQAVAAATNNPLSDSFPASYGLDNGLCSAGYPGDPMIDGGALPTPLLITLHKGDTVTVKARRGLNAPPFLPISNPDLVGLTASFTTQGRTVEVNGDLAAPPGPGSALHFTFTAR